MAENESIFNIPDQDVDITISLKEAVTLGLAGFVFVQAVNAGLIGDPGDEFFDVFDGVMERVDNLLAEYAPLEDLDDSPQDLPEGVSFSPESILLP